MLNFNFIWDLGVSIEQMVGFRMAAAVWSHYITDDIDVNLHIASADSLGEEGQAVGGAVPLFHEVEYGVFKEYYGNDVTSDNDTQAEGSLEEGNNVNLMINGQVVDGNTEMLITSAQAKALGMDQALQLDNGTIWERDLVNPNALDGYIIINQSFDWNYDFAREHETPEQTLDFFSMALHEIGHQLGFVSGIDGTLDVLELHSGEIRIEDFTVLDLFRKTIDSGTVSDVTLGENAYFSLDGGVNNLANFSTGNLEEDFQASHWERLQNAIGVMDPTLAYKEQLSLTELDLQAFDVLGYNVDSSKIGESLELSSLLEQAEAAVSQQLGLNLADLTEGNGTTSLYQIGYSGWWQLFEKQILEIGYSGWWAVLEQGYEYWEQELAGEMLEIGYSGWWQLFDEKMTELEGELLAIGYSGWWQEFKDDMLEIGYSGWWEVFEIGYSGWWQTIDIDFASFGSSDGDNGDAIAQMLNSSGSESAGENINTGDEDDIVGGTQGNDLISGLKGDDIIDGKSGADMLMGDEGDDIVYGWDGNDTIYGGEGDDLIAGERDDDLLYGEEGADIIAGDSGDDIVSGGTGKDVLKGDQGQDLLMGGTDDDLLEGGDDTDLLLGETGNDVIDGGQGDDILYGDRYPDAANFSVTGKSAANLQALQAFIGVNADTSSVSGVNFWMRLEAESMKKLINYNQTTDVTASGESVITTGGNGKAKTTFTGPTGLYDIAVSYYDSDGGQGNITLKVGYQELDSWVLNQDSNGFVTRIIEDVDLNNGDLIKINSQANGNESVKIDYLDIISVDGDSVYDYGGLNSANQFNLFTPMNSIEASTFRLETEAMTLANGYQIETEANFSGGSIISNPSGEKATATYIFDGNSGVYDIFASYLDGIDGKAQAQVKLNGSTLSSWTFKEDSGLAEYRLVGTQIALNQGDVIEISGQAKGSDLAKIDYLDFVPASNELLGENGEFDDYIQIGTQVSQRVEAENMTLMGNYQIENEGFASGGALVQTKNQNTATIATTTFDGATGLYNIVLGYYDENDGLAQFDATLNGIQALDSWQTDLDLGDNLASSQSFVTRTLARRIFLNSGDELQLEAIREQSDYARIDYVEFVPYDSTAPIRVEAEYMNATGNYLVEEYDFVSSGRVLRADSDNPNNALQVNTVFTGESGQYTVVVRYFDENDGEAQYSATLAGVVLDSWVADQNLGGSLVTPETSVVRAIADNIEINTGDVLELSVLGNSYDYGRLDYVEFIPYNPNATEEVEKTTIQLEIEDMQLTGGLVKTANFAYGGGYVQTSVSNDEEEGFNNNQFTASTLFLEEEGYYDIEIGYYDTNQGEASLTVKLNEDELSSWINNQDLGTPSVEAQSLTTRTVAQTVYLQKEDVIQVIGQEYNGDRVNADYIRLIPVEPPTLLDSAPIIDREVSDSENGDILRGGSGNDQLFGDEGDDLLYGEDEYDAPNSANGGNDTIQGGLGNDVLYGNSGNDLLYGDEVDQDILLFVDESDDSLTGNSGDDNLFGGLGNDVLNGTDKVSLGIGEVDLLTGGFGADVFILGDLDNVYYFGQGDQDFVVVTDFDPQLDSLQLYGTLGDYQQTPQGSDLLLSYQGDLVAIFPDNSSLSLGTSIPTVYITQPIDPNLAVI